MIEKKEKDRYIRILIGLLPEKPEFEKLVEELKECLKEYNDKYLTKDQITFVNEFSEYLKQPPISLVELFEHFGLYEELEITSLVFAKEYIFFEPTEESKENKEIKKSYLKVKAKLQKLLDVNNKIFENSKTIKDVIGSIDTITELKENAPVLYNLIMDNLPKTKKKKK